MKETVKLSNGIYMPILGLGTWQMADGEEAQMAVRTALDLGYRLIDTAAYYGNERSVGKAVRESGIAREDVFVTTKLWPTDFFDPRSAFEKSLKLLGLDYIDLYLIHWPIPGQTERIWPVLEKIYEEKLTRAIGVSNYGVGELRTFLNPRYGMGDIKSVLSYARVPPAVNQIKFSPFDFEREILEYCKANDIVVEAYSPLTRGAHLSDATIVAIAKKYSKTPAQIMIRWCIEHGTIVIPKTSHAERMKENAAIFDFTIESDDMVILDDLG